MDGKERRRMGARLERLYTRLVWEAERTSRKARAVGLVHATVAYSSPVYVYDEEQVLDVGEVLDRYAVPVRITRLEVTRVQQAVARLTWVGGDETETGAG